MSHHLLIANKLTYTYPGNKPCLNDISFTLHHGDSVALIGANGAGKSTLLKSFAGLVFPDQGYIQVGDLKLKKNNLDEIRRALGYIFQDVDNQLFMPTVLEDVAFGLLNKGMDSDEARVNAEIMLDKLEIKHLSHSHPAQLSGGEKRLTALAGVLVMHPNILLMDEPGTGLDPQSRKDLIELLKKFKHTKLIATHDLDMAWDLCDRIILIDKGKLIVDGNREILRDKQLLQKHHLDLPLRFQNCE